MAIDAYSAVARTFDASFDTNLCRKAYDLLGWEAVAALPLPADAHVIDAGCGSGRWCERFLRAGHRVTGIEPADGMVAILRERGLGPRFTLMQSTMEDAVLPERTADLVVAIGSLQYSAAPERAAASLLRWLKPGGRVVLMVDSLLALVQERIRENRHEEAQHVLETRRGSFTFEERTLSLQLHDRDSIGRLLVEAGFELEQVRGLVVSAATLGRPGCSDAMRHDAAAFLARDKALADHPVTADGGLHLLAVARRPERS
ncbi:class I SAM-dependent methyltransferase [Rhizosaccharibacter radicis]|uniref:Methyltransferase domain-containing protein n=1 Tax=Rhizosaccharibacter radicis TaxID=2782605 RepID=A0ABT1VYN5_9PROT|nr:methyltransferase domain-containing protein [Acetobacteraceae bacterium KSS12]